jgi:hypothetical protein
MSQQALRLSLSGRAVAEQLLLTQQDRQVMPAGSQITMASAAAAAEITIIPMLLTPVGLVVVLAVVLAPCQQAKQGQVVSAVKVTTVALAALNRIRHRVVAVVVLVLPVAQRQVERAGLVAQGWRTASITYPLLALAAAAGAARHQAAQVAQAAAVQVQAVRLPLGQREPPQRAAAAVLDPVALTTAATVALVL